MNKTILCNITMRENIEPKVYACDDKLLTVSGREVKYPINSILESVISADDDVTVLLLVKKDPFNRYERNVEEFKAEFDSVNRGIGARAEYKVIDTAFDESASVHEELLGEIVANLADETVITADITFGPKDVPIIVFYALGFAERFLNCEVERIVYGKADFLNGEPVNTKICDMTPLFCLGALTNMVSSIAPEKAREMLRSLLSFE